MPSKNPRENSGAKSAHKGARSDASLQTMDNHQSNRSKTQMGMYNNSTNEKRSKKNDSHEEGPTIETLNSINVLYKEINEKHEEEVEELQKEIALLRSSNAELEKLNKELKQRNDEAGRENYASVSKQEAMSWKIDELQRKNTDLENDLRNLERRHADLSDAHSELKRKENATNLELIKSKDTIKKMKSASQQKQNRTEERLLRKIKDDERLLAMKDNEIADLKHERDMVQKASINIREELHSARRRAPSRNSSAYQ